MAKELPYFQFEPAEYLTGDISFCSLSAQGLFTILCSYYWQRSCKLTKDQFLRRINNPKEFQELVDENVIQLEENNIKIKFLDEQLNKVTKQSKTNSVNGKKGGRPKKETQNKPKINPNESETKGIREDKIREDNIYTEKDFLTNWSICRKTYLNKPTNIKKLDFNERKLFDEILKDYIKEEVNTALLGLFKQKDKSITSMFLKPKHFLEHFVKYYNAELSKDYELYGKGKVKTEL